MYMYNWNWQSTMNHWLWRLNKKNYTYLHIIIILEPSVITANYKSKLFHVPIIWRLRNIDLIWLYVNCALFAVGQTMIIMLFIFRLVLFWFCFGFVVLLQFIFHIHLRISVTRSLFSHFTCVQNKICMYIFRMLTFEMLKCCIFLKCYSGVKFIIVYNCFFFFLLFFSTSSESISTYSRKRKTLCLNTEHNIQIRFDTKHLIQM